MGCVGVVDESGRRHGIWLAEDYVLQPFQDRAYMWRDCVPDLGPVAEAARKTARRTAFDVPLWRAGFWRWE
jgi:hypothetical protein